MIPLIDSVPFDCPRLDPLGLVTLGVKVMSKHIPWLLSFLVYAFGGATSVAAEKPSRLPQTANEPGEIVRAAAVLARGSQLEFTHIHTRQYVVFCVWYR